LGAWEKIKKKTKKASKGYEIPGGFTVVPSGFFYTLLSPAG
jgi:hypothetical protein